LYEPLKDGDKVEKKKKFGSAIISCLSQLKDPKQKREWDGFIRLKASLHVQLKLSDFAVVSDFRFEFLQAVTLIIQAKNWY
jgi:hypothetical protein